MDDPTNLLRPWAINLSIEKDLVYISINDLSSHKMLTIKCLYFIQLHSIEWSGSYTRLFVIWNDIFSPVVRYESHMDDEFLWIIYQRAISYCHLSEKADILFGSGDLVSKDSSQALEIRTKAQGPSWEAVAWNIEETSRTDLHLPVVCVLNHHLMRKFD